MTVRSSYALIFDLAGLHRKNLSVFQFESSKQDLFIICDLGFKKQFVFLRFAILQKMLNLSNSAAITDKIQSSEQSREFRRFS